MYFSLYLGTHAMLEECCKTVLPKKRKRHILTTHPWAFSKNRRRKFAKMLPAKVSTSTEEMILDINVEHLSHGDQQDGSPGQSHFCPNPEALSDHQKIAITFLKISLVMLKISIKFLLGIPMKAHSDKVLAFDRLYLP